MKRPRRVANGAERTALGEELRAVYAIGVPARDFVTREPSRSTEILAPHVATLMRDSGARNQL